MITSLFSIFDPSSSVMKINYLMTITVAPTILTMRLRKTGKPFEQTKNSLLHTMKKEMGFILPTKKGNRKIVTSIFMTILVMNVIAMFPQTFANTSQLTVTLPLAVSMWLSTLAFGVINHTNHMLAHLVPQGTPTFLMNFMVLIEMTSNLIRPITLCVRLTANITAGHLLITLLRQLMISLRYVHVVLILTVPLMLTILETAVAFIQAYVFITLLTLYASETQYAKEVPLVSHSRKKPVANYRFNRSDNTSSIRVNLNQRQITNRNAD